MLPIIMQPIQKKQLECKNVGQTMYLLYQRMIKYTKGDDNKYVFVGFTPETRQNYCLVAAGRRESNLFIALTI